MDYTLLAVDDGGSISQMPLPNRDSLKEAEHVARDFILTHDTAWTTAVVFADHVLSHLADWSTENVGRLLRETPSDWNLVR